MVETKGTLEQKRKEKEAGKKRKKRDSNLNAVIQKSNLGKQHAAFNGHPKDHSHTEKSPLYVPLGERLRYSRQKVALVLKSGFDLWGRRIRGYAKVEKQSVYFRNFIFMSSAAIVAGWMMVSEARKQWKMLSSELLRHSQLDLAHYIFRFRGM